MVHNSQAHQTKDRIGLSQAIREALAIAQARQERVFVVGGVVRDVLMDREIGEHDLDIVVEGEGIAFARRMAERLQCVVREHQPFLTAKLLAPFGIASDSGDILLDEIDIATSRQEVYERPGALPSVSRASIETDLWRRDFSANAIAVPLELYQRIRSGGVSKHELRRNLIDPTDGSADIQSNTLRILHPKSFIDDPTRLFRAVRYLVRLGFHFDMATLAGFLEAVKNGALATLSPRRVWNEVLVAFDEEAPFEVVQEFIQRGLFSTLPVVSPEDPAWALESLEHLGQLRKGIGQEIYKEAGKVLLIAGLLRAGREDVAHALHEGNRVLQRAGAVLEADKNPGGLRTIPDVAAAYCVHCTQELQRLLSECLQREGSSS